MRGDALSKSIIDTAPSKPLRAVLRLPIWLYRLRLGWLLGKRFLLLEHTGRKSGRMRETVIEVVKHDPRTGTYYVVSGWGARSDWYLNVRKNPRVTIRVGGKRLPAQAAQVPVAEAADILKEYSERYPLAFRELAQLFLGEHLQPGYEAGRRLAERMPMVAFRPAQGRETHP
jgi:deazaflavin-dependent oxidoreductase (nitroreductase family)